ncbi:MAG: substrate-binding domain-containing protein, partial [Actinomycetes bacterium]
ILNPSYVSSVATGGDGVSNCIDFARMSRAKKTDGTEASLTYYAFARDAVTWSVIGSSYAPTKLTTAQIKDIFECTKTDWSQVGGQKGAIHVYVNPTSAATYTFFLQTIGSSLAAVQAGCGAAYISAHTIQQNDGTRLAGDPQGIAPYGVTKWAAEQNQPTGISDLRGGSVLGAVNNTVAPTITQVVGPNTYAVLNPAFATGAGTTQGRLLFNAVRNTAPDAIKNIFKPGGYLCTNQNSLLIPFGATPLGTDTSATNYCGQAS